MGIFVVALSAFIAAGLTLFSGFGLGTLLMPVVALFFPLDMAIAVTAVVHLANNLFKLGLVGWHASSRVLLWFGIPAALASLLGAFTLGWLSHLEPVMNYTWAGRELAVMPVKLVVGTLILIFVALEAVPALAAKAIDARFLPLGGCLAGFLGGLSGHQGAFRSMFLLKSNLSKESFIATGVVLAVIVDLARTPVYAADILRTASGLNPALLVTTCLAAFAGSILASRWLKKLTIRSIQMLVGGMLVVVALGLMSGLL